MKVIVTPEQYSAMTSSEIVKLMQKNKSYAIERDDEGSFIYDRKVKPKKIKS